MSLNGFRCMQTPKFTFTPDFSRLECIVQLICVLCCNSSDLTFLLPLLILPLRYFLLCVNYFFYGETVTDYFSNLVQREEPLRILSKYHRLISFAMYLTGEAVAQVLTSFLVFSSLITDLARQDICFQGVFSETGGRRAVLFSTFSVALVTIGASAISISFYLTTGLVQVSNGRSTVLHLLLALSVSWCSSMAAGCGKDRQHLTCQRLF